MVTAGLPAGRTAAHRGFTDGDGNGPDGLAGRHDDDGQDQERQGQTGSQDALPEAELVDEDSEREETVHNRRHGGQVGDVDLDDFRHPIALGVLLEIHPRRHAQRNGRKGGHGHDQQGAHPGGQDAGLRGASRREIHEEIEIQAFRAAHHHVPDEQENDDEAQAQEEDPERLEQRVLELALGNQGADFVGGQCSLLHD